MTDAHDDLDLDLLVLDRFGELVLYLELKTTDLTLELFLLGGFEDTFIDINDRAAQLIASFETLFDGFLHVQNGGVLVVILELKRFKLR